MLLITVMFVIRPPPWAAFLIFNWRGHDYALAFETRR